MNKRKRKARRQQRAARRSRFDGGQHVVIAGDGDPCPRCGWPTEIREHRAIGAKQLRQPFYFARWFYCVQFACKTTMIMPERYKVARIAPEVARRTAAIANQLGEEGHRVTSCLPADVERR